MFTVAVTGGLAAGKSQAARLLAVQGAIVFSADQAVRAVQSPHGPVVQAIAQAFGPEMVRADGSLDRARLGEKVFADPDALQSLNRITHPPVLRLLRAQMDACCKDFAPDQIVVSEVPLLFETNMQAWYERIVVVRASESVQIARLAARNGLDEVQARARLHTQMPQGEKARLADWVIDNDGTLADLTACVQALWKHLRAEAARAHRSSSVAQAARQQ